MYNTFYTCNGLLIYFDFREGILLPSEPDETTEKECAEDAHVRNDDVQGKTSPF